MNGRRVELGLVAIRFVGGKWRSQRAERIARMTFQQVQRLISAAPGSGGSRTVESLDSGKLRVSTRGSDTEIAAAVAAKIHRSLTEN